MLLVFMLFALITTIGSDFMSFVHIDILQFVSLPSLEHIELLKNFVSLIELFFLILCSVVRRSNSFQSNMALCYLH